MVTGGGRDHGAGGRVFFGRVRRGHGDFVVCLKGGGGGGRGGGRGGVVGEERTTGGLSRKGGWDCLGEGASPLGRGEGIGRNSGGIGGWGEGRGSLGRGKWNLSGDGRRRKRGAALWLGDGRRGREVGRGGWVAIEKGSYVVGLFGGRDGDGSSPSGGKLLGHNCIIFFFLLLLFSF